MLPVFVSGCFQEKLRNRQIRSGSPGVNKIHHMEKMEKDITVEDHRRYRRKINTLKKQEINTARSWGKTVRKGRR